MARWIYYDHARNGVAKISMKYQKIPKAKSKCLNSFTLFFL
ncbi:hypothetical protein [Thermococcus paralvinellae]|nr:hypothetical protein [Thermococcus paralvinellae]